MRLEPLQLQVPVALWVDGPWYKPFVDTILSYSFLLQGCQGDGSGKFGDCCSGNCDGFALGENAEDYDWSVDETPVTEWLAVSNSHLCKVYRYLAKYLLPLQNCVDHYIGTISNHYRSSFYQTTMFI